MDEETYVCAGCVGEPYLASLIIRSGSEQTCNYCGDEEKAFTIEELAGEIDGAFERHYFRTSDQPDAFESAMLRDKELAYDWDRHGEPVQEAIADAALINEDIAADVLEILSDQYADFEMHQIGEECEFDPDSNYEWKRPSDYEFQYGWNEVEASLKTRSRFFNEEAVSFLTKLFANLDGKTTEEGKPVIVEAGPNHELNGFFRGRVLAFGSEVEKALCRPDIELASPPSHLARAGRMNAHGISMFYGATEAEVALAEIRPPVGSGVVIGRFELMRNVRLLDLAALTSLLVDGSIFDPQYLEHLSQARFLKSFAARMTTPVMPGDEPTEYLATQMVADFLAHKADTSIDGILYRSAQVVGDQMNVALFNASSMVEPLSIPEGTEIFANTGYDTEDGPEIDYSVSEQVPPKEKDDAEHDLMGIEWDFDPLTMDDNFDTREPTLQVDLSSLRVHHVQGVSYQTEDFGVRRHRYKKRELPF